MPSSIQVRPFRRGDRDQLTQLVNAHVAAVVPGVSVSVHTVLSQLERQPGEFITDPWVSDRATLVAEQGGRVQAAAHLLRYYADERAGEHYRDLGELRWFVFWPEAPAGNPWWPDANLTGAGRHRPRSGPRRPGPARRASAAGRMRAGGTGGSSWVRLPPQRRPEPGAI